MAVFLTHSVYKCDSRIKFRDAPIIGIGRFADNRNRPITMPVTTDCYILCIMMALDAEIILFFYLNGQHKFSFYS